MISVDGMCKMPSYFEVLVVGSSLTITDRAASRTNPYGVESLLCSFYRNALGMAVR